MPETAAASAHGSGEAFGAAGGQSALEAPNADDLSIASNGDNPATTTAPTTPKAANDNKRVAELPAEDPTPEPVAANDNPPPEDLPAAEKTE